VGEDYEFLESEGQVQNGKRKLKTYMSNLGNRLKQGINSLREVLKNSNL
jgi:hypothetical protein